MNSCRGCGGTELTRVLDLGNVPAADHFPLNTEPVSPEETAHALAMDLCGRCGLAQLADDDTVNEEPRGIESQALRDQAAEAVQRIADAGWLRGTTVREFGSPCTGGTWLPLLADHGYREAAEVDGAEDAPTWCSTHSASCTMPTSGPPSNSAPRQPRPTECY